MGKINMLVAKFVDDNYMCDKISYANFGIPIEEVMIVLPINEDVSFNPMNLKEKSILLEISEKNIFDCQRNRSFHVNKAIPIRNLNDEELSIIRFAACQNPESAYRYALFVDQKPTDKTRSAACKDSGYAYEYASNVDKKPTNETRSAACQNLYYAYYYARNIDKKPTNETRNAVCNDPYYAYYYALEVDRKPTDETRNAVCQSPECAYKYAKFVDKKPTNETRTAACKDPYYKEQYEKWEKSIC
jgi:hypothetical protein